MTFREFLDESKSFKETNIEINGETYRLIRTNHVSEPRGENNKIPKDGNLTKSKYEKIINLAFSKIDINKIDAITWSDKGKSNGIVLVIDKDKIKVITAIINSKDSEDKLFKDVSNKIRIIL